MGQPSSSRTHLIDFFDVLDFVQRRYSIPLTIAHAEWQARGHALRPAGRRQPLPHFWPARTAGVLRRPAAVRGHVRRQRRTCDRVAGRIGVGHRVVARYMQSPPRRTCRQQ